MNGNGNVPEWLDLLGAKLEAIIQVQAGQQAMLGDILKALDTLVKFHADHEHRLRRREGE